MCDMWDLDISNFIVGYVVISQWMASLSLNTHDITIDLAQFKYRMNTLCYTPLESWGFQHSNDVFGIVICITPTLGVRGRGRHLDLLCFHITQMCVSVRPSVSDFVYVIFPAVFLPMVFKFSDMVIMDKSLNWIFFRDYGSIFKVSWDHYVSKLTLFT